jgi:MmyB-like transcription regulator ligand binding domain/Helix-turn-helix domain
MDNELRRVELRDFLRSRRARIRPEDVGLPSGGRRRVPGLRREEVAALAGVGVTWYTMFETGTAQGVSDEVVTSVARALQLSPAETDYLGRLARGVSQPTGDITIDPVVLRALEQWIDAPAYIITTAWNILAWNEAFAFVWAIEPPGSPPFNVVVRMFVDPVARAMHGANWYNFAGALVAMVRVGYGRHAGDPHYQAMLSTLREDPDFAAMWERHDVANPLGTTRGEIESPSVGTFVYEVLNLRIPMSEQLALIVQVPDEASGERLRVALQARQNRMRART